MSTRYEAAGTGDVRITVFQAGEEVGMDVIPEGQLGLIFNYDEVFYIQGPAEELIELMQEAIDKIKEATDPQDTERGAPPE
jgi:hypothetical protein